MGKRGRSAQAETLLLALGANAAGLWGEPRATLRRALRGARSGRSYESFDASNLYSTQPLGPGRQPRYLNAVRAGRERACAPGSAASDPQAHRASCRPPPQRAPWRRERSTSTSWTMGADAWAGRRAGGERGRLILPHPELHARAFVLVPLLEVAPAWRHPVLGATAKTLLSPPGAGRPCGRAPSP